MKTIISILVVWVILFLMFAFAIQEINPAEWSQDARVGLVFSWIIGAIATILIWYDINL